MNYLILLVSINLWSLSALPSYSTVYAATSYETNVTIFKTEIEMVRNLNMTIFLSIADNTNEVDSPNIPIQNVIRPCIEIEIDAKTSEASSKLIAPCKGEYRHCGDGVFKCIQVSHGLFACCDLPQNCPTPPKQ